MSAEVQPKYLNLRDAAKYCGLSERTLKRAIKTEKVKSFIQGRRLIDRQSLDAWIEGKDTDTSKPRDIPAQIAFHAGEIQRLSALINQSSPSDDRQS